jgi:hypothetical protein
MSEVGTVNPSTGDLWISFDGGWDGWKTIQAEFQTGTASMTLYDNGLHPIAVSTPNSEGAVLSYQGISGAAYFLKLSGTSTQVTLTTSDSPPLVAPLTASSPAPSGSSAASLLAGRFASSSSPPAAVPQTAPSGNDLVWSDDDDWITDSMVG